MNTGEFARLEPANEAAKGAFRDVVSYTRAAEDRWHAEFVKENSTNDPQNPGYFSLSFDIMPEWPKNGWRIGRGTPHASHRNIDILAVCPAMDKKEVARMHAVIQFNVDSGALMLKASSHPVIYYLENDAIELSEGKRHVLYQHCNVFQIGQCQYRLRFEKLANTNKQLLEIRKAYFEKVLQVPLPNENIDAFPTPELHTFNHVVFHKTLNSGTFGWVRSGVDKTTGRPLAVKEIRIKNSEMAKITFKELTIAKKFEEDLQDPYALNGLLPTIRTWCEHRTVLQPCQQVPDVVYISHPLAMKDFWDTDWITVDFVDKLKLCRDTLEGLANLHRRGYMHRDITFKNMLVMSLDPPKAVLCDWGKCTPKSISTNTVIGPFFTLAPEVMDNRSYDKEIDIYSIAYAWIIVFGKHMKIYPERWPNRTTLGSHNAIKTGLQYIAHWNGREKDFVALLINMLEYEPDKRPTLLEALNHRCWSIIPPAKEDASRLSGPDVGGPVKKRAVDLHGAPTPQPQRSGPSAIHRTNAIPQNAAGAGGDPRGAQPGLQAQAPAIDTEPLTSRSNGEVSTQVLPRPGQKTPGGHREWFVGRTPSPDYLRGMEEARANPRIRTDGPLALAHLDSDSSTSK